MSDRPPLNESEYANRAALVAAARAMLSGELSFHEGAVRVHHLKEIVGGVREDDEDFDKFWIVATEDLHLPLEEQRQYWSPEALAKLGPEFKRREEWARSVVCKACENIIARFGQG